MTEFKFLSGILPRHAPIYIKIVQTNWRQKNKWAILCIFTVKTHYLELDPSYKQSDFQMTNMFSHTVVHTYCVSHDLNFRQFDTISHTVKTIL